jgi:hypothetical protein
MNPFTPTTDIGEIAYGLGQLIGTVINVWAQYIVWRFMFVYVWLDGDKIRYAKYIPWPDIVIVFTSFALLLVLAAVGAQYPMVVIIITLGLAIAAIILTFKWRQAKVNLVHPNAGSTVLPSPSAIQNQVIPPVGPQTPNSTSKAAIVTQLQCSACKGTVQAGSKFCNHCGVQF